jgi:ribonuclease HIII
MKKINAKKLNQFYMSGNNSQEMKSLVHNAIDQFVHSTDAKNPVAIALLEDLGLLMEA